METTPTESWRNRPPLGRLRERDIDLLLCCELHCAGALRDRFAEIWDRADIEFSLAQVSYPEPDGETDLVVEFRSGNEVLCLLVENKVDAEFQDGQAERYADRAKRWEDRGDANAVRTLLLAPSRYLERAETDLFDECICYESLIDVLKGTDDDRSYFLSRLLKQGIDKERQGYTPNPDEAVTEVWRRIYERSRSVAPELNMKQRLEGRPLKSSYIYFRHASGFPPIGGQKKGVVIKGDKGVVDLQFSSTGKSDLESIIQGSLCDNMEIARAGKSAVIRIRSSTLDFRRDPSTQIEAIDDNLKKTERLRKFYIQHESILRKVLFA